MSMDDFCKKTRFYTKTLYVFEFLIHGLVTSAAFIESLECPTNMSNLLPHC